jgi:glycerol-3-phosphate dehydrogenase
VFQNSDGRLIFASPYERDFTLIGTASRAFKGDPAIVAMAAGDVAYLCDAANRYFRERIETVDVVRTLSGANMVMKPRGGLSPRDGAMTLDYGRGKAPLITVFGGDVTTSRLRAERAVSKLTPFYPMSARWTAKAPLPAAILPGTVLTTRSTRCATAGGFSARTRRGVWSRPTGRTPRRSSAKPESAGDLGPAFGPELTGAEVRYLMQKEWARFPDDILWRRTKLGLTMPPSDREALAAFMAAT